ncbi:MAG: TrkH family potassium uptake protein [Clostridia bacterium]|nr:TrkH family potassium uptake protein [Clostridia bacterium]
METVVINTQENIENNSKKTNGKKLTPPRVLVLGFLIIICLGAIMLMLPQATIDGQGLPVLDAFFTATSAVCVTGLVVVDTGTFFTIFGQLVILLLIQVGGIGFMTFAAIFAIFLGRKISFKERLMLQNALNQFSLEGIVRLVKYIIKISFAIEGLGALALAFRWRVELGWAKAIYYGAFHSVSGFNNAGFDLLGNHNSLTSYQGDIFINVIMMFLVVTGGLGFAVLSDFYTFKGKKLSLHSILVIKCSLVLIVGGAAAIYLLELFNPATLGGMSSGSKVLAALFQSISSRTAGFNTIDISGLKDATKLIVAFLMFIGASPGSTGGGIKTTTFLVIVLSVFHTFKGDSPVEIRERTIPKDIIHRALSIMFMASLLIAVVTLLLTITEKGDFLSLFFETVSAFGTVGLSTGITPFLSSVGKIAIICTMFSGRVGLLTLAFALSHKRNISRTHIKYPEERIIIG